MPYVQIPKDLTQVKSKLVFNMTKRQLLCFGGAAATAIPFYLLTSGFLGTTGAALGIIVCAVPWFALALYERDGIPLEKYLMTMIRARFLRPRIRKYQTQNFYAYLQAQAHQEKEEIAHGTQNAPTGKTRKRAKSTGRKNKTQ